MSASNKAAVLWTGGKDSALALMRANAEGFDVDRLITFAPVNPQFLAHPSALIKLQSEACRLPHTFLEIREPYRFSYVESIRSLKNLGIDTLITGDIALVGGSPNWIRECSKASAMEVYTPLWGADRRTLLQEILTLKFEVVLSLVKKPWFEEKWAGRILTEKLIEELSDIRKATGLDLCGEEGEYHTMVTDAPFFHQRISMETITKSQIDLFYLEVLKMELAPK